MHITKLNPICVSVKKSLAALFFPFDTKPNNPFIMFAVQYVGFLAITSWPRKSKALHIDFVLDTPSFDPIRHEWICHTCYWRLKKIFFDQNKAADGHSLNVHAPNFPVLWANPWTWSGKRLLQNSEIERTSQMQMRRFSHNWTMHGMAG